MPPSPPDEVRALCERLIEGLLTAEEKDRLEQLVLASAEARRLYVEHLHLHAALQWQAGTLASAPLADVVGTPRRRPVWRRVAYAAGLPAMLLLGLMAARLAAAPRARPIATLRSAHDCRWEGG